MRENPCSAKQFNKKKSILNKVFNNHSNTLHNSITQTERGEYRVNKKKKKKTLRRKIAKKLKRVDN